MLQLTSRPFKHSPHPLPISPSQDCPRRGDYLRLQVSLGRQEAALSVWGSSLQAVPELTHFKCGSSTHAHFSFFQTIYIQYMTLHITAYECEYTHSYNGMYALISCYILLFSSVQSLCIGLPLLASTASKASCNN